MSGWHVSDDTIQLCKGFTLDLARGCLAHAGERVHLRPQSFEVLRYLVENKGRLISKDKLIEHVWQGRAVTDGSLGKCIEEVREALGADARQYLRNVRGRGYIFDPEVNEPGNGTTFSVRSEQIDVMAVVVEDEEDEGKVLKDDRHKNRNEGRDGGYQPQSLPIDLSGLEQQLDWPATPKLTAPTTTLRPSSNAEYVAGEIKRHKRAALLVLAALVIPAAAHHLLQILHEPFTADQFDSSSCPLPMRAAIRTRNTSLTESAKASSTVFPNCLVCG